MMQSEKTLAKMLIKKYQTHNPFRIAQAIGILLLFERLGENLGYYNRYKRVRMIHINQDIPKNEQQFVCAHELGHALLHPNINTPFLRKNTFFPISKIEREANTFAVELLLTDSLIKEYKDCDFHNLASQYGIPPGLVCLKK